MLDLPAKKKLIQLTDSPNYEAITQLADLLITQWQNEPVICESEFDTIKKAMEKEFKVQALRDFLAQIYKEAYDNAE